MDSITRRRLEMERVKYLNSNGSTLLAVVVEIRGKRKTLTPDKWFKLLRQAQR